MPATIEANYFSGDQDRLTTPKGPRQFDIRFDMRELEDDVVMPEYEDRYRKEQLLSTIGERLGVLKNLVTYEFRGNQLYGLGMKTSMLQMIDQGIAHRHAESTPEDQIRQQAEKPGFERVQAFFSRPSVRPGDIAYSFSPPGVGHPGNEVSPEQGVSFYGENFADEFVYNADGTVSMTRILTNLTLPEHYRLARSLNPNLPSTIMLTDAYLLAHPVLLEYDHPANNRTILVDRIQKDVQGMIPTDFETEIVPGLERYIEKYIMATRRNKTLPDYEQQIALHFNAILRVAQELKDDFFAKKEGSNVSSIQSANRSSDFLPTLDEIRFLASQPIDELMTGCGLSGAYMLANPASPWRVWDLPFAMESYSYNPFVVGDRIYLDDGTHVIHDGYPLEDNIDTRIICCESKGHRYLRPYYGPRGGTPEPCCRECGGREGIACVEKPVEEKNNVVYFNPKELEQELVEPEKPAA